MLSDDILEQKAEALLDIVSELSINTIKKYINKKVFSDDFSMCVNVACPNCGKIIGCVDGLNPHKYTKMNCWCGFECKEMEPYETCRGDGECIIVGAYDDNHEYIAEFNKKFFYRNIVEGLNTIELVYLLRKLCKREEFYSRIIAYYLVTPEFYDKINDQLFYIKTAPKYIDRIKESNIDSNNGIRSYKTELITNENVIAQFSLIDVLRKCNDMSVIYYEGSQYLIDSKFIEEIPATKKPNQKENNTGGECNDDTKVSE